MPSLSLIHNQPAPMAEVNEDSPAKQLPDLSRFPTQRQQPKSKRDKESLKDGQASQSGDIKEQRQSLDAIVNRLSEKKDSIPSEPSNGVRMDPAPLLRASPFPYPPATVGPATVSDSAQEMAAAESLRKAMQDYYHPTSQSVNQGRVAALKQALSVNKQLQDASKLQRSANPNVESLESLKVPRPLSGGTRWPEKSKPKLAVAARDTLMSIAGNAGKQISIEEIKAMLDQDPSYSHLCDVLEHKGFIVHRSQFAQSLLSAVPSVSSNPSSPRLAQDSPKRGPGRPRNDGLPPRRRDTTLNITEAISGPSDSTAQLATTSAFTQRPTDQGTTTRPLEPYNGGVYTGGTLRTSSGPDQGRFKVGAPPESGRLNVPAVAIQEFPPALPGYSAWRSQKSPQGAASSSVPLQRRLESAVHESTPEKLQGAKAPKSLKRADKRNMSQESSFNRGNVDVRTGYLNHTPDNLAYRAQDGFRHDPAAASGRIHSEVQPKQGWTSGNSAVNRSQAEDTPPVPLTKAEMARKRSFSEIVDLTEDLSESDAIQRHKRGRTTLHDSQLIGPNHISFATPAISTGSQVLESRSQEADNLIRGKPSTANADLSGFPTSIEPLPKGGNLRLGDVVKPLEKKKALRRSSYNGKTIARDILISLGKHPTERPLNWHLLGLRDSFKNVANISDLDSFCWELVDPGRPAPQASKIANLDGQDAADSEMVNIGSEAQLAERPGRTVAVATGNGSDVDIVDYGKEMHYHPIVRKMIDRFSRKQRFYTAS